MKNHQKKFWKDPPKTHGGERKRGEKTARPIVTKRPMHLVFRSTRATGKWNFLRKANREKVERLKNQCAERFHVKVYRFENVGNHFHVLVQVRRREDLQNFLRVFGQMVAFAITGARKGKPIGKFWDELAFSRIIEWGKDWRRAHRYLDKNQWEASGIPRDQVDRWFRWQEELLRREGVSCD